MWRAQVEALTAAGRRAVAIDLPGHGRRAGEPFTLDGAVDAVADAVDRFEGPVLVVGLSLGGYVSITYAARYPKNVVGLVAAACSTRPARIPMAAWMLAARAIGALPDAGAGLNRFMAERTLTRAAALDVAAGGFALDVMDDVLREMSAATPLADLARISAPVWLVNGRFDHFRTEERRFLAACHDGRLVVVRGAKHLVNLDAPVAFGRVLLDALVRVEASDPAQAPGPYPAHDPR
jgi:pimeloyl-ACP methyl ester carboxylesterase